MPNSTTSRPTRRSLRKHSSTEKDRLCQIRSVRDGGMAQEETMLTAHDKLRHCKGLLARWTGSKARLWALTLSHCSLTIRLEALERKGNLHIICLGPERIHAPVQWTDADIHISLTEKGTYVVSDQKHDVAIWTEGIEVKENCKPMFE